MHSDLCTVLRESLELVFFNKYDTRVYHLLSVCICEAPKSFLPVNSFNLHKSLMKLRKEFKLTQWATQLCLG